MINKLVFTALLFLYVILIIPFTTYLNSRPVAVKLGYMPEAEVIKLTVGDQRYLFGEYAVVKVLFYFGTLVEKIKHRIELPPEYFNMFKTLQTAVKLDPYNMDAYYFAQAAFTWEVYRAREVNDMLEYGMDYRTWDYNLPFFAGFNAAYFLHDYASAANYMKKAAEISKNPLLSNLAARYFYEAGNSDLGILFLTAMQRGAKDENIRQLYELRKNALLAVRTINDALLRFKETFHKMPKEITELTEAGMLAKIPEDPYGGKFYLDEKGTVRSTSKFAFGDVKR